MSSQNKYAELLKNVYIYNITLTNKKEAEMSNVEQEITDLIGEVIGDSTVVEDAVDNALNNNYDFQDMQSRVDSLESQIDSYAIDQEQILMKLAHLIVKDDPSNKTIVYQSHIDNLKKEIEDLKKALADKEESADG
jgi:septation ring formation regulator EzrA